MLEPGIFVSVAMSGTSSDTLRYFFSSAAVSLAQFEIVLQTSVAIYRTIRLMASPLTFAKLARIADLPIDYLIRELL